MEEILRLNEFFVEGGNPEISHVLLHITEPSTPEEKAKGYFFAVCEIDHGTTEYLQAIQTTVTEIENNYYKTSENEGSDSLETILEQVNQTLPARPNLHCLVGVIRHQEIIFSFTGHPLALFFYKNKEGQYQTMDLVKNPSDTGTDEEPSTQLFSQVIQGQISPGDYLCIGTPQFSDYFNADRLQKIITTRPPRQSAEHLERVLKELKNGLSFGGLILQLSRPSPPAGGQTGLLQRPRPKPGDSALSLTSFFSTEKNTAATLTASVWPKIREVITSQLKTWKGQDYAPVTAGAEQPLHPLPKTEINSSHFRPHVPAREPRSPRSRRDTDAEWLVAITRGLWLVARWLGIVAAALGSVILALAIGLGRNVILLMFVIINYRGRRQNIIEDWGKQYRSLRNNLAELPLITKILTVGVLMIVIGFSASLLVLRLHQQNSVALATYNAQLKSVTDKIDSAKSALVYGDETKSLEAVREAASLLSQLPCANKDAALHCQQFNTDLDSIRIKVRKITFITPELLTSWDLPAGVKLTGLVKINQQILAYSATDARLFSYDLATKQNKIIPLNFNLAGLTMGAVPKENDYALFLSAKSELLRFDPTAGTIKKLAISYPNDAPTIANFTIYNRRLYTLDTANNQLYKHDTIKNGFALGKPWLLSSAESLRDGVDLAIDGDIWALNNSGQVNRFVSGASESFTLLGLDPPLGRDGKIWTYNDMNNIYVLDGENKRLVILDKTGRLKTQLVGNQFDHPSDGAIDEIDHTAFIVDGSKLYKISLPL